jgi:hypothetical protein
MSSSGSETGDSYGDDSDNDFYSDDDEFGSESGSD